MSRLQFFVSPSGPMWKLTHGGRVLYTDARKLSVVARGRAIAAANMPSELLIMNANGQIAERETYGNDPFPPRG